MEEVEIAFDEFLPHLTRTMVIVDMLERGIKDMEKNKGKSVGVNNPYIVSKLLDIRVLLKGLTIQTDEIYKTFIK